LNERVTEIERELVFEQIVGVVGADIDGDVPGGAVDLQIAVQMVLGFVPMMRRSPAPRSPWS
jgi:hypothetical protein